VGGPESSSRNFFSVSPRSTRRNQGDAKIDHRLFGGNNLLVRVSISQQSQPNQGAYIYSPQSFGQTQFSGFSSANSNLFFENSFQWADHLSIIRGSHRFKTGGEIRRFRFDGFQGFPPSGNYYFGATYTSIRVFRRQRVCPTPNFCGDRQLRPAAHA